MIEKLGNVVFSNDDIDLDVIGPDIAALFSDGMGLVTIDHNNINLNDDNFDEDDPINIVFVRLIAWCNRFKQSKAGGNNIDKKLLPIAWHPTRV